MRLAGKQPKCRNHLLGYLNGEGEVIKNYLLRATWITRIYYCRFAQNFVISGKIQINIYMQSKGDTYSAEEFVGILVVFFWYKQAVYRSLGMYSSQPNMALYILVQNGRPIKDWDNEYQINSKFWFQWRLDVDLSNRSDIV